MLDNGDSTLIKIPSGETILIDTGEEDNIIVEFLLDKGIKKINYFVISHFDSDHSGKATEIIERLNVENLIFNEILMNWPMKVLCKADCKGICKMCGKDLNLGECGCDTFVPSPGLAGIKEIFNANKEV